QRRFHGWLAHGADVQALGEGVSWEEAVRKADKADFHFMVWTRAVAQVRGADLRPLSAPPKILLALRQHLARKGTVSLARGMGRGSAGQLNRGPLHCARVRTQ